MQENRRTGFCTSCRKETKRCISEALSKAILRDTGIRTDLSTFRRTYAGRWQKAAGAFLWTMQCEDGITTVGGTDRASDCIRPGVTLYAIDDGFCEIEIVGETREERHVDISQKPEEGVSRSQT